MHAFKINTKMNRLFLIISFFLASQAGSCQMKNNLIVNDNWIEFDSIPQRIKALQIRPDIITTISTEDLLDECLNFPYLIDFYLYGRDQNAFELFSNEFNGLKELIHRQDLPNCLLRKFESFPKDFENIRNSDMSLKGRFSLQTLLLEYILIQNDVLNLMSETMLKTFTSTLSEISEIICNNPAIFSNTHYISISKALSVTGVSENRQSLLRDLSDYSNTTIYTPKGTTVSAYILQHSDLTPSDSAYIMNEMANIYSQAEVIEGPTMKYNCHGYAWHVSEGGNKVWLDRPYESTYWTDGSYAEVPESIATKVSYLGDHSAVRLSSSQYISKWGAYPLVKHAPNYVPIGYSSPSRYYLRAPYFTGPNLICSQGIYTLNNLPANSSISLITNYSLGYYIQVSPNLSIISYSNGSLSVQKVSDGKGYI